MKTRPALSIDEAFTVVYVLQEHYGLIPDIYEQCYRCKEIYNSEEEGFHYEDPGINICDTCCEIIFYRESSEEADTREKAIKEWYSAKKTEPKKNEK